MYFCAINKNRNRKMKTALKLSTLLVALVSAFTFSSCLNSDDNSNYPTYRSYVTITGDKYLGYTFYADFGSILVPSSASDQSVLNIIEEYKAKRAYIAFDLTSETENGKDLEAGKEYHITVRPDYTTFIVPTYNSIMSREVTDTLHTNNKYINDVNKSIWAINGYVNAQLTIGYDPNKRFYLNTFYTENDIDITNNTLHLNLYYNNNTEYPNSQGSSIFSFRLPEQVAYNFTTDSINLVLKAITEQGSKELTKVAECKVAKKDFYQPRGY